MGIIFAILALVSWVNNLLSSNKWNRFLPII
jgi:hypothetical protein